MLFVNVDKRVFRRTRANGVPVPVHLLWLVGSAWRESGRRTDILHICIESPMVWFAMLIPVPIVAVVAMAEAVAVAVIIMPSMMKTRKTDDEKNEIEKSGNTKKGSRRDTNKGSRGRPSTKPVARPQVSRL